jgi:endonuclease III
LKRKYPKVQRAVYDEPVDAVVYGILSENMSETAAQSVLKRLNGYFVDWNDLRVSRVEEIIEVLGDDTPVIKDVASALTRTLRAVFDQYNTVSLESLKKIGKRPAKQILEKMDGTSHFVVNYCMLTALQGHAIPLTKKMIEYLRNNQLVHPDADEQDIEGFLARQVSVENAYEFYTLLRRDSESRRVKAKTRKVKERKTKARRKVKIEK